MDPDQKFSLVKPDQWQALESSLDWLWTIVIVGGVVVGLVLLGVVVAQIVLFRRVADLETACKQNADAVQANAVAIKNLGTNLKTAAADASSAGAALQAHVETLTVERVEWQEMASNMMGMFGHLETLHGQLAQEVTAANVAVAQLRQKRLGHASS